jgi:endoglucanase Acf2
MSHILDKEWWSLHIPFQVVEHKHLLNQKLIELESTYALGGSGANQPSSRYEEANQSWCRDKEVNFAARATPTSAWWSNLISGDGNLRVSCYPYLILCSADKTSQLEFCWPKLHVEGKVMWQTWCDDWQLHWRLRFNKKGTFRRVVTDFDDLSVTVEWRMTESITPNDTWVRQYLVKCTPYITVQFNRMPYIRLSTRHRIRSLERRTRYSWIIRLENQQTWALFVIPETDAGTKPITVQDATSKSLSPDFREINMRKNNENEIELIATDRSSFTGVIRMAGVPQEIDKNFEILLKHAWVYPTGGTFSWQMLDTVANIEQTSDESINLQCYELY